LTSTHLKIALLTTDNRENDRRYDLASPYFGTAPEALLQGFAELSEMEVHVISCTQRWVQSPEKLADNIWFHSLHVPKIGWLRTAYQGCIRATRRFLRQLQPDLVHGQGTERDCAISAALSGFPSVITIHGNMNALKKLHGARIGSYLWLAARLENFTLRRSRGIVCISDYVQHLVGKYGVPTWIVPNAVQKMFFDFPKENRSPSERPLLVNVGVISERKRQQQLLIVLESLRDRGLDFDALFVGRSNKSSPYARKFDDVLAAAQQKRGGFEHIQWLDDASFCRLFDRASAMIHFSSEESFGLTFAEAIARGLYLFASDVGGSREIAAGVERAQIFSADDWIRLERGIREWLVSGKWKEPRPKDPPEAFTKKYHPASVAQRHVEIYHELLRK
jgi:glycosyltransferase involved in cell wall biosynthesis